MYSSYSCINVDNYDVSIDEIARYMGCTGQSLDDKLRTDIERCKEIILKHAKPRFVCASFELDKSVDGIELKSTNLTLTGNDIQKLLAHSDMCVLMAATIGIEVDKIINYHNLTSITDGVIMDAAASAAIEAVCDAIETQLRAIHSVTRRYSCGYGDLPIELQPKFLSVLNTQKLIGLYCNESNIMIPRKSVTAIMGITETGNDNTPQKDCATCLYNESCIKNRP